MNPNEDGKRMLKLELYESFIIPWDRCPIPKPTADAECGIGNKTFKMEPTPEGLKVTRIE